MKLSNQALGAVMLALQKSLLEQSDIVPILLDFDFERGEEGLVVTNPPVVEINDESFEHDEMEEAPSDLDWDDS